MKYIPLGVHFISFSYVIVFSLGKDDSYSMLHLHRKKLSFFLFLTSRDLPQFCSCFSTQSVWNPTVSLNLKHPTLFLLENCHGSNHFKQILAQMMRANLIAETFPMSRLLFFSVVTHPEFLNEAHILFNYLTPRPNLYIYNIMISDVFSSPTNKIKLYKSLLQSFTIPDEQTFLYLLKSSKCMSIGKQVHVHTIINGYSGNTYILNSLCKMYTENGQIDDAHKVVKHVSEEDNVSRNIMISGYAKSGLCVEAFNLFRNSMASGIEPDQYTMVGLLVCCKKIKNVLLGKSVHGWLVRKVPFHLWGLILGNALLDMYSKCEDMKSASNLFAVLVETDSISWNIMIGGFSNVGELDTAYNYLKRTPRRDVIAWNSLFAGCSEKNWKILMEALEVMLSADNAKPDKVTALILLGAAAEMGVLSQGEFLHGMMLKFLELDAFLGSALIDMYCKCGNIERSRVVFNMVSVKDVPIWTAMLSGLAFHGHGTEALWLFEKMQMEGLKPNGVTLLGVLVACSHAGFVDQAYSIFENMKELYTIEPGIEHYGCLVDAIARTGRLVEAMDLIRRMRTRPSASIWGSILRSSKAYGCVELAEAAFAELMQSNTEEEGGYITLSNVYASYGKWADSDTIREIMENSGKKKSAGCSSIAVDGVLHGFMSSDKMHPMWHSILPMLYGVHTQMMARKNS